MAVSTVSVTGNILSPSGEAPTSGRVTARLSAPGSALDGLATVRVGAEVTDDLGVGGAVSLALVPNDNIVPSGTYYLVTIILVLANGRRMQWAERWSVPYTPTPIDVGSVPRLSSSPTTYYTTDAAVASDVVAAAVIAGEQAAEDILAANNQVNVKTYGAVCDGVTNDGPALVAMLASIGSTKTTVIVPGVTLTNSNLTFPTTCCLRFEEGAKFTGTGTITVSGSLSAPSRLRLVPPEALTAGPPSMFYIEDTATDADYNGDFLTIKSNNPALPRDVLRLTRLGGFLIWDWLAVAPQTNRLLHTPGNGAMLSVASDLGASGTTVAIVTNPTQHDFIQINGYNAAGFDSATRKFTFADTNVGGSYDSAGLLVFGPKSSSYAALKNSAGVLEVRNGLDNGYGGFKAQYASFANSVAWGQLSASPTNGGSVTPNGGSANSFNYTCGAGVAAFTINAPTNIQTTGQEFTFIIRNNSGGALTTTWNAAFKMAAWVDPGNGFQAGIRFIYNGTKWVEVHRGAVNVPL